MFINDVNKKEEIRNIATKQLRKLGIRQRVKYPKLNVQNQKLKKLFKTPLQNLENETVTLKNGQQLVVPKRLYEMCSYILSKVETEGLFRKEGSKSRQNEIKLLLDRGCMLGTDNHEIDVAVVLKYFLRELPEPLIPYSFHELFIRSSIVENKVEALLLACLLLPSEHLNVLVFLMQFFNEISAHSNYNKMNSYNLSLLIAPNIFPLNEKLAPKSKLMVKKTCEIVKSMIDNSSSIGIIPDYILEQIGNLKPGEMDVSHRTKRRRSGSLTRIFNGLKKIVTNKTDDITAVNTVTPDLLLTPSISIPKSKLVNTQQSGRKTSLVRSWSAITSATNFKRKKRNSFIVSSQDDSNINLSSCNEQDVNPNSSKEDFFVRVPKVEYEEIKNRVDAIEKRLSIELESVQNQSTVMNNEIDILGIQSAYEQTLGQNEPMSPGTDQLARKLSKELRIRKTENKMIRSPSARKIGNIRRRSRELIRNNTFLQHSSESNGSSPLSKISMNTDVLVTPSFKATDITYSTGDNLKLDLNQSMMINSPGKTFPRNSCLRKERRVLKRSTNVTPKKTHLKQKYSQFENRRISYSKEENKENDLMSMEVATPVPHIKRPLHVKPTPKRLCTTPRNTPLRALPREHL
ncbi:unnamed protein product [Phyllotreta striolata]|uniref:Rho-GAP domain-containing protein n=1 Tax=Phyllotreta striolata TaxID=444603 RepID=A0A9N9TEN0_PHYSR|nr:unnamed protein product [Phyllotreta striolata]